MTASFIYIGGIGLGLSLIGFAWGSPGYHELGLATGTFFSGFLTMAFLSMRDKEGG